MKEIDQKSPDQIENIKQVSIEKKTLSKILTHDFGVDF
jgi:hypothetical protein